MGLQIGVGSELWLEGGALPSSGELMSPFPFISTDVRTDKGMPTIDCSDSHPFPELDSLKSSCL